MIGVKVIPEQDHRFQVEKGASPWEIRARISHDMGGVVLMNTRVWLAITKDATLARGMRVFHNVVPLTHARCWKGEEMMREGALPESPKILS